MSSSTHRDVAAALRSAGVRTLAALVAIALGVLAPLLLASSPAAAASTTRAQLALSGVATSSSPTGGDTVGVHPGDSVKISASTVPTQGLEKLGLSDVLGGLLNGIAGYQVTADFSKLPGGAADTVLKGNSSRTFNFGKIGTYSFTWTAQRVNLLGGIVPIDLDGNQLKAAGVKLNANNEYVGKIVVANNPPKGGISVQVPKTSVQPEVGPVKLPKVTLPGVTTPSIGASVPSLNDGGKDDGKTDSGSGKTDTDKSTTSGKLPNVVPVPDMVVPQGSGQVLGSSSGYTFDPTSASQDSSNPFALTASSFGTPANGSTAASSSSGSSSATSQDSEPESSETDSAAAARPAATSGMPVVLAVIAVIALVLVAGTYARLFLLGGGSGTGSGGSRASKTS